MAEATGTGRRASSRWPFASWAAGLTYGRAIGLATAFGAVFRFAVLARQPLGYDEDFTALVVHQPVDRMIDIVGRDSSPPLFFVVEKAVVALADLVGLAGFGGPGGTVTLRLLPALAGIAMIPLMAALARRIGGDRAGIWAALFTALIPTTMWLSGFVRMYGLGATLTVAATLLLWRAVEKPGSARRWAAYGAAAAAAVWTDYFCAVALAGIVVAAFTLRPGWRAAATAVVVTAISGATLAPWLFYARAQFQHTGQGFWVPPLSPSMLSGTVVQLFTGPPIATVFPDQPLLINLQTVACVAGFAALAWCVVALRGIGPAARRGALYCLLAASGVLILTAISVFRPILDARYASVIWLPLFALAGVGLAAMPRRLASLLLVAVAVPSLALSVYISHSETSYLMPDLEAGVGPHDIAAVHWDRYLILLDESSPTLRSRLHVLTSGGLPWFVGTAAYPADAIIKTIPDDVIANRGRVFWVSGQGEKPYKLPTGYHVVSSRCVLDACLTVYGPSGS
ncbi:MAG TPA: glycosyltransferase family 39 protein [Candidatus Limnocylindrales bacterium]